MNYQKCISYKQCKENKTLMDNCIWFLDEESILKNEGANLKKCPFCGKEAVALRSIEDGIVAHRVRCSNAHCLARTQRFPALHQAEMEWNARTAPILRLEHWNRDWEYVIKHWL
jgi:hypothetical protein